MPPNSITLDFQKMPTVTVDGKTHKFQADKATTGFHEITQGGVTYSLVKDAASDRFQMTIKGEPAALEKYNFGVGKGRVTDAKFGGGDPMDRFFKGFVSVGDQKAAVPDYFQNFSIGGAHLADRTAFLQSGAWGLDANSAHTELQRLEQEAKEAANSKTTATTEPKKDADIAKEPTEKPTVEEKIHEPIDSEEYTLIATSTGPLSSDELAFLKKEVHENYHESLDNLVSIMDNASLRQVQNALKEVNGREMAHQILSEKDDALFPKATSLSFGELAQKTEANLAKLGLKANQTNGDGNCFFHAVADQGYWTQASVRRQVAGAMSDIIWQPKNRDLPFPKGLGGNPPTQEQLANTLLDASIAGVQAWGEDLHCAYVARAFDRPVVLIAPDRIAVYEKDQEIRHITEASELPKNAIFLSHKGGNHWESASPITG